MSSFDITEVSTIQASLLDTCRKIWYTPKSSYDRPATKWLEYNASRNRVVALFATISVVSGSQLTEESISTLFPWEKKR